ncbi:hypothetical protein [Pseudonocardia sp. TMWB2A]|uniref:hypothetical protein n=1 Tax=Pseudonocardia sp. TMWB2A TaxID=687430 RepID=UPI00307F5CB7
MAEKIRYPQIPSTVWWGLRAILQRTPNITVDERLLSVQLGVQEIASKAYLSELKSVGILTDDGKATPLAQRWRLDETYAEASKEIVENAYPEGLLNIAPPADAERQKVVSWFLHEGLGQGAAGNKAATYLLLASPEPNEAPRTAPKTSSVEKSNNNSKKQNAEKIKFSDKNEKEGAKGKQVIPDIIPLNINIQVHIGADAGTDQIESIFQAMRRYLYDAQNN